MPRRTARDARHQPGTNNFQHVSALFKAEAEAFPAPSDFRGFVGKVPYPRLQYPAFTDLHTVAGLGCLGVETVALLTPPFYSHPKSTDPRVHIREILDEKDPVKRLLAQLPKRTSKQGQTVFGLFSLPSLAGDIPAGTILCEYAGEVSAQLSRVGVWSKF